MSEVDEKEELIYDIRVVADARFAKAFRCEFSGYAKRLLINGLTAASIFVSAGLLITENKNFPVELVAVILVGISIFTMWMNLDYSEYELKEKAVSARQCAVKLNEIRKKLQHGHLSKDEALIAYERELLDYPDNHRNSDRDFAIYKLRNKCKKARESCLISAIPYFILLLWYPLLFIIWTIFVFIISKQIVPT
nr:SLATT domain-containing protein [uncultured Cohaesibacter sp.]